MYNRMDRYSGNSANTQTMSRTNKNQKLYDEVSDIDVEYIDVNNVLEIESSDLSTKSRSNYQKMKEFETIAPNAPEETIYDEFPTKKDKIYDIDEILRKAKEASQKEEQKKRLINTEYNILTKLDIDEIDRKDLNEEEIKNIIQKTYPEEEKDNNQELLYDMVEQKEMEKELTEEILNKEVSDVGEKESEENFALNNKVEEGAKVKEDQKKESEENKVIDDTTSEVEINDNKSKKILILIIIIVLLILGMGGYLFFKYFKAL